MGSVQVDEGYGFATVAGVVADPFPPGLDPAAVRLPTVPKLRSAEDDEAHHREYWRAHVWATLHRYQTGYEDPACPPSLRADHGRVADEARRLLERATATHPISPLDSVACHAALEGPDSRRRRPRADRGGAAWCARGAPGRSAGRRPARRGHCAGRRPAPRDAARCGAGTGVHGQDFFAPATPSRSFDLRIGLRGARGLRRGPELTEGRPGDDPLVDMPPLDDSAADSHV